ncbi:MULTISPECIES: hypothetical protein [Paenibacillus]|uniref:hypothetical protein n=1 Tax=Paenibacillus TaxID=44249 RepID=UPI002FE0EEE4
MKAILLWVGLFLIIVILGWLNQKQKLSGKVKAAYGQLRTLSERTREKRSSDEDLALWEANLEELEKHPNEYNKLDEEIRLREAFALYLERHYPGDIRLEKLREAAAFQKDSVWGMKIKR